MCSTLTLSITTRGIGINLSAFYTDVANLVCIRGGEEPRTRLPEIYASYRALLALVEMRLLEVDHYSHYEHTYRYSRKLHHYSMYYRDALNIPIIFKRYLEAINFLKHKDISYTPAMSKNIVAENGKFIPRPENIVLSNLRQTVVALEASDDDDDDNSLMHRMNFYRNNSIPGAIWDTRNYKLMNADEIIPADYNLDHHINHDIDELRVLKYRLSNFIEYINTKPGNKKESQKSQSIFICNEMGDLRVPDRAPGQQLDDYYWNCRPTGNIDEFYSRFKLENKHFINDGALFLLGEYPKNESFARPIYELRSKHVNSYWYPGVSYQGSYLAYHSNIVYRSLRNV